MLLARLVAVVVVAPLAAQDVFQIYPERNGSAATFTSRAAGGSAQVEILMEVPGVLLAGVGDGGRGTCSAWGYSAYMVDENPTTPEQVDVVFRSADPAGQPSTEIARLGPFTTPTLPSAVRSTVVFTVSFATPVSLPCQGTWFHGLDLYAAPNWPTSDGVGLFAAWYNPPATRNVGENARAGAPNLAWQVQGSVAIPVPTAMTLRMGPRVRSPLLSVGGVDPLNVRQAPVGSPNYGAGGLYPDVSGAPRSDGVSVLIEDSARVGGIAWGFVSLGLSPAGPLPIGGFGGDLWLHPAVLIPLGSAPIAPAGATLPVLAPGQISAAAVGVRVYFQAIVAGGAAGTPAFTNASGAAF